LPMQFLHQNWFRSGEYSAYASTTTVPQFQHLRRSIRFILWNLVSLWCSRQTESPYSHTELQTSQKKKLPATASSRVWKADASGDWVIFGAKHDFSTAESRIVNRSFLRSNRSNLAPSGPPGSRTNRLNPNDRAFFESH
jgi:hypothetical protein